MPQTLLCNQSVELEIRGGRHRVVLTIRDESTIRCATTLEQLVAVLGGESVYVAALWTQCRLQRIGNMIELHYDAGTRWGMVSFPAEWFEFALTGLLPAQGVSTA